MPMESTFGDTLLSLLLPLLIMTFVSIPTLSMRPVLEETNNINNGVTNRELITSACRHTKHVEMCESVLSSYPNSTNADLADLASISLDRATAYANHTIAYVADMKSKNERGPNDAFAGECLDDCLSEYSDALDNLDQSKGALSERSYDTVNAMVSGAMTDSGTCEDGFADHPGYGSPLTERNDYFHKLCGISLAIVGLLV